MSASNIIQIKHGDNAPGPGKLEPYELGYSQGKLYIGGPKENPAAIGINFILTEEDEAALLQKFENIFIKGKW